MFINKKIVLIATFLSLSSIIFTAYFCFASSPVNNNQIAFNEQRKFIGQEYDVDTGLDYLNARYYDAKRGKFITQDPNFWKPETWDLTNPQSLNSYSYANNNPVTLSDPNGKCPMCILGIGILAMYVPQITAVANQIINTHFEGLLTDSFANHPKETTLRMSPATGEGIAAKELFTGKDYFSGQSLSLADRSLSLLGFIPFMGGLAREEAGIANIAEHIGNGHAYDKHLVERGEFEGIAKTKEEFVAHIENVMKNPDRVENLGKSITAYDQEKTKTIVIHNPSNPDMGTAYQNPNVQSRMDRLVKKANGN